MTDGELIIEMVELGSKSFWWWLSGFVDGEGCFRMEKKGDSAYMFEFCLGSRWDNRELLVIVQRRMGGLGKINKKNNKPNKLGHIIQDFYQLQVRSVNECHAIADIFNRYPLRGIKKIEFDIWREAVQIAYIKMNTRGRGKHYPYTMNEAERLGEINEQLSMHKKGRHDD